MSLSMQGYRRHSIIEQRRDCRIGGRQRRCGTNREMGLGGHRLLFERWRKGGIVWDSWLFFPAMLEIVCSMVVFEKMHIIV